MESDFLLHTYSIITNRSIKRSYLLSVNYFKDEILMKLVLAASNP